MRKLNIAIIGLGNIGSYLFNYLNKNKKILSKKTIVYQIYFLFLKNKKRKRKQNQKKIMVKKLFRRNNK